VALKEGYGLALHTDANLLPGKTMMGHTGSAYGLYSTMFFHPQEKFGIVTITNGCKTPDTDDTNPFLKEVNQVLYKALIER
jgi:D-alanyl-D-alanine carboxypeptidase